VKKTYLLSLPSAAATVLLGLALAAPPVLAQEAEHDETGQESEAADVDAEEGEDEDVVVVQATRSGHRVQDEPIRVEVIGAEEIEEKSLMMPGNIAMLVAETGGVRVQMTAPALGAANVRMQGMRGRYTQLLADGLPLYGGQAIGLLQIPPTDLGQVEVIKGAASALYGPSALGGVINLVSRRPDYEAEGELLLNTTTRNGQDVTAYAASPLSESLGGSLVGGFHRQTRQDLDDDGWIDMPGYERWTVRPRLFWEGEGGANAYVTVGAMNEKRVGGTLPGRVVPDGQPFPNTQDSARYDFGTVVELPVAELGTAQLRASAMKQDHEHVFGAVTEDDAHDTAFAEASFASQPGNTSWLAGIAVQRDGYDSETFPAFNYTFTTPGVFAQVEQQFGDELTLAGSARWDDHSEYGDHFSPRLSLLYRPGPLRIRASLGSGFYAPTPFVEEIEAAGLSRLEVPTGLEAETAETASFDIGYTAGSAEISATLFGSNIDDAVQLQTVDADTVRLINANGVTRTRGAELLARYRWDSFTVTGSYVYVDASEPDPDGGGRRTVPVTPKQTAGFVAMWEEEGIGRLGFEAYYTGEQDLDDNPFRTESKPYVEIGMMGELDLGTFSVFANAENILDVRQTENNPLIRPVRAPDGNWTVDAWSPLEGFILNVGMRFKFGAE
jgi:outer membrane receptor for ferrienterochelin and colicins